MKTKFELRHRAAQAMCSIYGTSRIHIAMLSVGVIARQHIRY